MEPVQCWWQRGICELKEINLEMQEHTVCPSRQYLDFVKNLQHDQNTGVVGGNSMKALEADLFKQSAYKVLELTKNYKE